VRAHRDPRTGILIGFCIFLSALLAGLAGMCALGVCLGRLVALAVGQ
jgi:hypothetical protein